MIGYFSLNKTLPANVFADKVHENGEVIIQVRDNFDREYFETWKNAVLHNRCVIKDQSFSNNKPWRYITFAEA